MSVATFTLIRLFCLLPIPHRQGGSAILHSRKRQAQRDEECHELIIFADEMAIAMVVCVTGRRWGEYVRAPPLLPFNLNPKEK